MNPLVAEIQTDLNAVIEKVLQAQTGLPTGITDPILTKVEGSIEGAIAHIGKHPALNATTPIPGSTDSTLTKVAGAAAMLMALFFLWGGCSTNAAKNTAAINGAAITAVDQGMSYWAAYSQTHPVSSNEIVTISNAYNVYYNSECVFSNVLTVYAQNPSTNTAVLVGDATQGVLGSSTNLINLIGAFTK